MEAGLVANLWNQCSTPHIQNGVDELVYRSQLLGRDYQIARWSGGNISMKTSERDFRERPIEVLRINQSGSDLAAVQAHHFTKLRIEDIRPLLERGEMTDGEIEDYLGHCT